jgi:predicted transcriptional regulator
MTAFTIELDEATARSFEAAAAERDLPVEELIIGMAAWSLAEQEFMARGPFTPEQLAEIEQGLDEADRGETFGHEEVMAMLRERYPNDTARQIIERALESYGELLSYAADMPDLHEDWDAQVAKGLAAMDQGDETPQDQVFARWRTKYG